MDCENCRHLTVVGLHDTGPCCLCDVEKAIVSRLVAPIASVTHSLSSESLLRAWLNHTLHTSLPVYRLIFEFKLQLHLYCSRVHLLGYTVSAFGMSVCFCLLLSPCTPSPTCSIRFSVSPFINRNTEQTEAVIDCITTANLRGKQGAEGEGGGARGGGRREVARGGWKGIEGNRGHVK